MNDSRPAKPGLIALGRSVYGVHAALVWAILLFPIVSTIGFALGLVYPPTHMRAVEMLAENRQVENLTVYAYLVGCILAIAWAVRAGRRGNRRLVLIAVFLAALCLGLAGEEISWGQQVFHYPTPEFFRRENSQREVTIHNFSVIQLFSSWFVCGASSAGLLAIAFHTRRRRDVSGVPSLLLAFGLVVALLSACDNFNNSFFFNLEFSTEVGRLQELAEMLFAFALMTGIWLGRRRDARQRRHPDPTPV